MPLVSDFSADEEDDDKLPSGGGSSGGGGGGSSGAQYTPAQKQQESAFVPWSRFVSANADVSKREAGKLQAGVNAQADDVTRRGMAAENAFNDKVESNYTHEGDAPTGKPATADVAPVREAVRTSAESPAPAPAAAGSKFGTPGAEWGGRQSEALTALTAPARTGVKPGATGGPKSLEASMGATQWQGLMGDAKAADDAKKALGSQTGVQSLLQKQAAGPLAQNGAFDAALVSGAGGEAFRKAGNDAVLQKQLGASNQNAQGRWQGLMGDIDAAAATKKANDEWAANMAAAGAQQPGATTPSDAPKPKGPGFNSGFENYDDFKKKTGGLTGIHDLSQKLDPVSAAQIEAGKAGKYDGPTVSEGFRGNVAKGDLDNQNRMIAMKELEKEFGAEGAQFIWDTMTQAFWDGMAGKNWGYMYYLMKQMLDGAVANGSFKKPGLDAPGRETELQNVGQTTGDDSHGTTAEQETARNQAYNDGWGTQWDEQFRQGNRNPQNPNNRR